MKVAARVASACSLVVLTGLLGWSIFEGVGAARGTWRVVPVLSGSMSPRMPTGSAVIAWRKPLRRLHVGSILVYKIPVDDHHVEMHRVVSLKRVGGGLVVRTKGDANSKADLWTARLTGPTVWTVGLDVPELGWPIVYLQRPFFRLGITLAAAFGFLLSGRRRTGGVGDVVDIHVAEAVVGALEEELAQTRGEVQGEVDSIARSFEAFRDEEAHRRRMREVEALLAGLRPVPPLAQEAVAEAEPDEAISMLDALEERLATVRAGATGLAA